MKRRIKLIMLAAIIMMFFMLFTGCHKGQNGFIVNTGKQQSTNGANTGATKAESGNRFVKVHEAECRYIGSEAPSEIWVTPSDSDYEWYAGQEVWINVDYIYQIVPSEYYCTVCYTNGSIDTRFGAIETCEEIMAMINEK